jgi:uroporphyrinogen-III synthase
VDGSGVAVVVTRDEGPDGPLTRLLAERGLRAEHWTTIRTGPPSDPAPLETALAALAGFDWAVFTSPRAVAAVVERVGGPPEGLRVAAVGRSTAASLEAGGWPVTLVPGTQTGGALVTALIDAGVGAGSRVLFPASAIARDTVPAGLAAAGADVTQVEAYRTVATPLDRAACRSALESGAVRLITFTSPSSVENLSAALGADAMAVARSRVRAVAIGPTTAAAAESAGFAAVAVAEPHSLEGLAERAAESVRTSIEEG